MFTAVDIETGPLARDVLERLIDPFPPFQPPGQFDPKAVKFGNTKDEAKKAEKIEAARIKHAEDAAKAEEKYAADKAAYDRNVIETAALDARYGRILAIGYQNEQEGFWCDASDDERSMLESFWTHFTVASLAKSKLVGHNLTGFDVPFIIRRSWINGVSVPVGVLDKGRWWNECFVDTMTRWQCASYGSKFVSLDSLARVLGIGAKNGDGAMFATLWAENRKAAIEYLQNDLELTHQVAIKLGVK